jgi:uncharacterized protein (TIGR03435 family)
MKILPLPTLACLLLAASAGAPTRAQTVELYHPAAPLAAYDVATIKPADPSTSSGNVVISSAGGPVRVRAGVARGDSTIKNYILNAYGASQASQAQIVGGPAWLASDVYTINGKVSDDLRAAMDKMTPEDRANQTRQMQQSLLADRFHLKAHIETRTMPVYELAPVKGGLKLKPVPAPAPFVPGSPPPPGRPGGSLPPGSISMRIGGSTQAINAAAIDMRMLITILRNQSEIGGKPILDKTAFTEHFDVANLQWANLSAAQAPAADNAASDTDAPSLFTALEETLGLKLTPTKGPVEVLVIDSIDRPSEN